MFFLVITKKNAKNILFANIFYYLFPYNSPLKPPKTLKNTSRKSFFFKKRWWSKEIFVIL